jgi:hypothetical protein
MEKSNLISLMSLEGTYSNKKYAKKGDSHGDIPQNVVGIVGIHLCILIRIPGPLSAAFSRQHNFLQKLSSTFDPS